MFRTCLYKSCDVTRAVPRWAASSCRSTLALIDKACVVWNQNASHPRIAREEDVHTIRTARSPCAFNEPSAPGRAAKIENERNASWCQAITKPSDHMQPFATQRPDIGPTEGRGAMRSTRCGRMLSNALPSAAAAGLYVKRIASG